MRCDRMKMLVIAFSILLALGGCDSLGNFCNPFSQTSATVLIEGDATMHLPAPVVLEGVTIGEVKAQDVDEKNRPYLELCLDKEQAERLDRITVFYIEREDTGKDRLVCQTFPEEDAPANEEMRFLGFGSYSDFIAWRAQSIVKKGVDGFLKALDEAFDSVNK